jgi:hypothetical protein
MAKQHKPHWYRLHIGECPVCGRDKSFRERVYGKKPKKREDRIVWLSDTYTYDHCLERQ